MAIIKENQGENSVNLSKYLLWFISFAFIFLFGFGVGKIDLSEAGKDVPNPEYVITGDIKEQQGNVDVNLLWDVWATLEKEYIDNDINGQDLLYGAVKGLVDGLDDPYTNFLTPEETETYLSLNKGEFEGIGTTLRQEGDYVVIESPIDGSPAKSAGLEPNDVIQEVDGADVIGLTVGEVAEKIRGKAGTKVKIALYRPSTEKSYEVDITRDKIDVDNISFKELDNDIVEIRISQFTEESVDAFNRQWDRVVEQVLATNPKGIIVDLRYNPGGYVSSVEYATAEFLEKGDVIFMEENKAGKRTISEVNRKGRLKDVPVVVIVNSGSASASEIFAGAMQDHKRATIIGMPTVGKGVEQKIIDTFPDGSTLQVVFQRWLTPSGKNISHEDPIQPDILLETYEEQNKKAIELLS